MRVIRKLLCLDHHNEEDANHVNEIINNHKYLSRLSDEPLGHTDITTYKIATTDYRPINTKQYRFPPIYKNEINKQAKDLLENDVIQLSDSPYNSRLWIVPKKPDSKCNTRWRMVIDYRALNEKTIGDAYLLLNIKRKYKLSQTI